ERVDAGQTREHLLGLTNQTPMRDEGPVNKQSASDQVSLRHRPPIPAIKTVLAIVAHRKVSILWHLEGLGRVGQMSFGGVAVVTILSAHGSFETVTFRHFSIHVQLWRLDSQLVARQTGQ